jgi:hypothetical protein
MAIPPKVISPDFSKARLSMLLLIVLMILIDKKDIFGCRGHSLGG